MFTFLITAQVLSSFFSGTQTSIQNTPQDPHCAGTMKLSNHVTSSQRGSKNKKEEKRQGPSDSVLNLMDRRHYRHSYLVQNLERKCQEDREGENQKFTTPPHWENHTCTSRYSPDAKIMHVAIASIISGEVCPLILYSKLPLLALKVLNLKTVISWINVTL